MKLVKIYQAKDEIDGSLIVGYLESNGIKAFAGEAAVNTPSMLSGDARSTVQHLVPRDIFVREDRAVEAAELINEVRN
jgi:hypothetical protein